MTRPHELEIEKAITSCPLLAPLSSGSVATLKTEGRVQSFETGKELMREGDSGDELWLLVRGSVQATTLKDGLPLVIARLQAGDVIGEVSILQGTPRTCTVIALENVVAISFPASAINKVIEDDPLFGERLTVLIEQRAFDTIGKLM